MTFTEAVSRYMTGKGYLEAAKMVYTSPHRDCEARVTMTVLPLNMLVGFALELFFKAWLLAAGRPSKEVRGYGHRLTDLYGEVLDQGLPNIDKLDQLVEGLGAGHEDYTFRYINNGDEVNLITWVQAFPILDELDRMVDAELGASASIGLAPGH